MGIMDTIIEELNKDAKSDDEKFVRTYSKQKINYDDNQWREINGRYSK